MAANTWRRIPCKKAELQLDKTLCCGQSFRWKERSPGVWTGVLLGYGWNLWQNDAELLYQVFPSTEHSTDKSIKTEIKTEPRDLSTPDVVATNQGTQLCKKISKMRPFLQKHVGETSKITDNPFDNQKLECKDKLKLLEPITGDTHQETNELESILQDYFRLDVNLTHLYAAWSQADPVFKRTATDFVGVRILRQDPVENLFALICSSNNHISRISGMVERLCQTYGSKVADHDGESYFSFPSVESLAEHGVEDKLRELGFGYRAKYISVTARYIQENHSEAWLRGLRNRPYAEVKSELMKLCGVGAKVADCVCLMSMDKLEAVPVDTHVWQIAARDYLPKLKQAKSLTAKLYGEIGDHFRGLWGDKAGWAHSVLFVADLKTFKKKKSVETATDKIQSSTQKIQKKSQAKGQKRSMTSNDASAVKGKKAI